MPRAAARASFYSLQELQDAALLSLIFGQQVPLEDQQQQDDDGDGDGDDDLMPKELEEAMTTMAAPGRVTKDTPYYQMERPSFSKDKTVPGKLENPYEPDRLPLSVRRSAFNKRRKAALEGAVPKNWARYPIDGKVFAGPLVKGKSIGRGTIVVDLSSSMYWGLEQIDALLTHAPEATMIGYCGRSTSGRIAVLADRGRAASPQLVANWRAKVGGGNIVDVPVLELLNVMPGPRVWICDGGVTGQYDRANDAISNYCRVLVQRGGIVQYHDITGLIQGKRFDHIG